MERSQPEPGLRERGKAARRRRIIDAARDIFRSRGYETATTREIAFRASVGAGTLFHYARDKRALLMMVFYDDLDGITERARAALPDGPLLDQLLFVFAPRYEYWGSDPVLSRCAVAETFSMLSHGMHPADASNELGRNRTSLFHTVEEIVERHQAAGTVTGAYPACDLVRLLIGVYLNESRDWLQADAPDLADGLSTLRRLLTVIVNGLTIR